MRVSGYPDINTLHNPGAAAAVRFASAGSAGRAGTVHARAYLARTRSSNSILRVHPPLGVNRVRAAVRYYTERERDGAIRGDQSDI